MILILIHMLVLDLITEFYMMLGPLLCYYPFPPFWICNSKDGLLTLTMLLTSLSLACISANLDLTALYLNVIFCLMTSSLLARNSSESNSINLYSMFWIKSKVARPSLCITKTERKLWGSLMQLFSILIMIWLISGKSMVNF